MRFHTFWHIISAAMEKCRHDLNRQLDAVDWCEHCPLLGHCAAWEKEEADLDEWHH